MASKAARTLETLEKDIRRLKKKARVLEQQLDDNFTYFQQHSGTLFVRSLLPRKMEGESVTGIAMLDPFLQNERLQKVLAKVADILAERLGDGLNWVITRVFKK